MTDFGLSRPKTYLIEAICEAESNKIDPVAEDEVRKALSKLKNNKAADTMGLCSEHLKLGGTAVVEFITSFLNCLIRPKAVTRGFLRQSTRRGSY